VKAKLEFNLPDDQFEYDCARTGKKWRRVVCDLREVLRNKLKYAEISEEERVVYTALYTDLFDRIRDEGLDLDE
jgi:hypothetical protein